jgi:hypothetical protein
MKAQLTALALAVAGSIVASAASAQVAPTRSPSPKNATLYFHYPRNNTTVPTKFKVLIGLRDMGVAPAGVQKVGTGHHHLFVDTQLKRVDQPIPNDPQHIHLGNGQTEVEVTLPPGRHTLQLVLGDHDHIPHDPPVMSLPIQITVRDREVAGAPQN